MLIVWDGDDKRLPEMLVPYRASHPTGTEHFKALAGAPTSSSTTSWCHPGEAAEGGPKPPTCALGSIVFDNTSAPDTRHRRIIGVHGTNLH
jgi:hypothetical protein